VNREVWDVEEEKGVSGKVFKGASRSIDLGWTFQDIAHHYVLTNTTTMVV
jgi:hypothetical protein